MSNYKYSLIRYVLDPIRDEAVNVGLIVHSSQDRYMGYRLDLRRVTSKLARVDKDVFKHYEEQLEAVENEDIPWEEAHFENLLVTETDFLDKLADYMGTKICFASPRGIVTDNPDQILDELFVRFVSVGRRVARRVTKKTIIREVTDAFRGRGIEEYVKKKPTVIGEHRNYTLPLGILHAHRTFVEALRLGRNLDKNYRAMAAVGRLWQDARSVPTNRNADLRVVLHYSDGRLPEGEGLLRDDDVRIVLQPARVLSGINVGRIREWD